VRAARRHLGELEKHLRPAQGGDLFSQPAAAGPARSPALQALEAIDPDALTPKEALEALYRLKKLEDE
jgi:DNA mismatch repair protein MutS